MKKSPPLSVLLIALAALSILAALAIVGLRNTPPAPNPTPPPVLRLPASPGAAPQWEMRVQAAADWQSSGIVLQAGDWVEILYVEGKWRSEPDIPPYEPNGGGSFICEGADCIEPLPGRPKGGLVGRIGVDGAVFWVGNRFAGQVEQGGTLYLAMNDPGTHDNSGAVLLRISQRPAGEGDRD